MRVAIIGAGPAGLAAIRHCLEQNVDCVAYEQSGLIGGTWNYIENVDDGVPVHSSMYKGLRTNLPKELMEFEGFRYENSPEHYISQAQVLNYIKKFADNFNLLPHIKFHCTVTRVDPLPAGKWGVKVLHLKTNEIIQDEFDGVLVCNGHFSEPFIPSMLGMNKFNGDIIHSHLYRNPDRFSGKRVLIIGGGFSGIDISKLVVAKAEKVYLSIREHLRGPLAKGVIQKPVVSSFKKNSIMFDDGTIEDIDSVIFCTGYKTVFPFLSENCKISVDDNWVKPLYKHIVNIEYPSMGIINIGYIVCPFPIFAIQIRFFLALLKGRVQISKDEMYADFNKELEERIKKECPNNLAHFIGPKQLEYCEDLASIANIERIPRVIGKMFKYFIAAMPKRPSFNVLNDEEYEVISV